MFLKKGNVIYRREFGWKTKQEGGGRGHLSNEPATDTFPHDRIDPWGNPYPYPKR